MANFLIRNVSQLLLFYRRRGIGKHLIHLTFDDGPHPTNTPQLLDVLKRAGIQATFFVLGDQLETSVGQELIQRAAAEGHQIGNHSYSHTQLTELSEDKIRQEISKTEELIGDANRGVKILRPPYGQHNALVDRVVEELGYRMLLWNVDTADWDPRYSDRWVEHAMRQIITREQSIVLAHDVQMTTLTKIGAFIAQIQGISGSRFIGYSEVIAGPLPSNT